MRVEITGEGDAQPKELVEGFIAFKYYKSADIPVQTSDVWASKEDVLRNYAPENGWRVFSIRVEP